MSVFNTIKKRIVGGSERSSKFKKNIVGMFFIKGGSIIINLMLVPITLNYVDSETYGIWLALSSMVTWIHYFDIGINNGLKNNLTSALAKNDLPLAKKYVSTTYAILSLIFVPITVILLIIAPHLNWGKILSLSVEATDGIVAVISILLVYFCINFIFSTINIILQADQRPADASLRQLTQQLLSLLIIYILTLTTKGSLLYLCMGLCLSPLIVILFFNFTLFRRRYKKIAPSFKSIDFSVAPDLMKLGVMFFICQIAFMIRTQMANFLIIHYYGATDVTNYNIASRYFGVSYMVWGIMITPIWAAVTDAVTKGDFKWINVLIKRFRNLLVLFFAALIIMLFASDLFYDIWIGDKVSIPFLLSFWVMLLEFTKMVGSLYVQILNGAGELKIQTITSIISPFVFFGIFFLLLKNEVGVYSVIIASILSSFNGLLIAPIQCHLFIKKNKGKK